MQCLLFGRYQGYRQGCLGELEPPHGQADWLFRQPKVSPARVLQTLTLPEGLGSHCKLNFFTLLKTKCFFTLLRTFVRDGQSVSALLGSWPASFGCWIDDKANKKWVNWSPMKSKEFIQMKTNERPSLGELTVLCTFFGFWSEFTVTEFRDFYD